MLPWPSCPDWWSLCLQVGFWVKGSTVCDRAWTWVANHQTWTLSRCHNVIRLSTACFLTDYSIHATAIVLWQLVAPTVRIPEQCLHLIEYGCCLADKFKPSNLFFSFEGCWASGCHRATHGENLSWFLGYSRMVTFSYISRDAAAGRGWRSVAE